MPERRKFLNVENNATFLIVLAVYGAKAEEKKEGDGQTQEDGTVEETKAPERNTKMPQITAIENEDTEEDLKKFGVIFKRIFYKCLSVTGSGMTTSPRDLTRKLLPQLRNYER